MQLNSIHEPVRVENERTPAPFPTSGNNFVTLLSLDDTQDDALALLEALGFVSDMQLMLDEFHRLHNPSGCTGTVGDTLSDTPELASKSG